MSSTFQSLGMSPLLQPHSNFNVTNLGLISLQSRIPAEFQDRWVQESEHDGNSSRIVCWTGNNHKVPHHMANELFMGIIVSLIIEGIEFDERRYILRRVTIPQLLARAGYRHKLSGPQYRLAYEALKDLRAATYEVSGCWRAPTQEKTIIQDVSFNLINRLERTLEINRLNPNQEDAYFDIYIDMVIANSINSPLTLALNLNLLHNLTSPQARGLYRIVESTRRDNDDPSKASETISLRVDDLRSMMRVLSNRHSASALLRNLQGPLEQMRQAGYLKSYTTTGRGDATILHLIFEQAHSLFDVRVLKRLNELGIVGDIAKSLAATTTLAEIDKAEEIVERDIKARQHSNRPITRPIGYLVSVLRDGRAREELMQGHQTHRRKKTIETAVPKTSVQEAAPEPETQPGTPEAIEAAIKNLHFTAKFKKVKVKEEELSTLEELIMTGKLDYSVTVNWLMATTETIEAEIKALLQAQ